MKSAAAPPSLDASHLHPGMSIAVACSGGADSVALLRVLMAEKKALGLAISIAHMNHGIRGEEANTDQAFVEALASEYSLPLHLHSVDTPRIAETDRRGLEESARHLRYTWFWELLAGGQADAVVTAHTLDDQAETVLHRFLRGAWTEGLAGIFPILQSQDRRPGIILRPLLSVSRAGIESWLQAIGQPWREDSTNRDVAYTRNRLRHKLLPVLMEYNPNVKRQFTHLAAIAREEEAYWQAELTRILPSLLLPGKPVRGGGRATGTFLAGESLAIEIERLRPLPHALRRRVLRAASGRLGVSLDFESTERLLDVCGLAEAGRNLGTRHTGKLEMANGLRAELTLRELRLLRLDPGQDFQEPNPQSLAEYALPIPGSVEAVAFGVRLEAAVGRQCDASLPGACLRAARSGDRVVLRHSRSRLKIQEALRRTRQPANTFCPVLEWQGEIVWVPGVPIESSKARDAVLTIISQALDEA